MVFFPPQESPSFPIHRRPHISPVCGLVRIRTRRLLHANHESRTGTKPERLATRTHQRAFIGPYVPWNSRSIVAVDKESCGQGLHASALRRSYIPMNGALPGIVPACTLPRSGVLTFPPLRRVHGASDGEGVQDS